MNDGLGNSGPAIRTWEGQYRVRQDEVGANGELQVPSLLNFLQDAALHHAEEIGVSIRTMEQEGKAWVLRTIRVELVRPLIWGDVVKLQTWPTGINGLLAFRDYHLLNPAGQICVRADSSWLMIDRARRRPIRLPADWKSWNFPGRRAFKERPSDRLAADADRQTGTAQVEAWDLDFNGHVNHVHYIDWLLRTLPEDLTGEFRLNGMTATFIQEAVLGEQLCIECSPLPQVQDFRELQHKITRLKGSGLVVAAATAWTPGQA